MTHITRTVFSLEERRMISDTTYSGRTLANFADRDLALDEMARLVTTYPKSFTPAAPHRLVLLAMSR